MRATTGVFLLLALFATAGCSGGSGSDVLAVRDSAIRTSDEAVEIIDAVVEDEDRAKMAKQAARKTKQAIVSFYANVIVQRDELTNVMGKPGVTKADCQPILANLQKLRTQHRERMIDSWLMVRTWMTPGEWVTFNTRLQRSMDLD